MSEMKQFSLFPETEKEEQKKKKILFVHEGEYPTQYSNTEWPYKPNIVQIEAVQGCNRTCSFCGTAGMERAFYFADLKTIEHTCKLISEAKLNCRILLAGHGEPTLHKRISEIISTIRKYLPENMIHLFSNGTIIEKHPEITKNLFDAGLNDLIFDEYSDHRVGEFVLRDKICNMYPIVKQQKGVPLFGEKNFKSKRICIVPPIDGSGNTMNRALENHCGAGTPPTEKPYQKQCPLVFRDFYVRWDGNVAICCNDFRGEYFVVNINECNRFADAWFHERMESARRFLMIGDRASIFPCSICNSRPIRPGLLPDSSGKLMIPKPNEKDLEIVSYKYNPLAKIVRRDYEKKH